MSACGHGTLKSKCDECDRLAYIKFLESKNSKLKVKLRKCREAMLKVPNALNDAMTKLYGEECSSKTKAETAMRCEENGGTLAYFVTVRTGVEKALEETG